MLRERLRTTDVIARLGGDEFAVLLRDVTPDRRRRHRPRPARGGSRRPLPARRRASAAAQRQHRHHHLRRADDLRPAELLVNADIAMYDAKEAGRDRVALAAADVHQERVKSRQTWLERIRTRWSGTCMELHAQPILHLATGRGHAYELLLRMRSDTGELIPPAAFLDIAERSGMIRDIDHWVVRSACRMIAEADADGRDAPARGQRLRRVGQRPGVLALIEPTCSRSEPLAERLVIELTETAAVGNLAHAIEFADGPQPLRLPVSPWTTSARDSGASTTSSTCPAST